MRLEKEIKYLLYVACGEFATDQWEFETIEQIDEFIVEQRRQGTGNLVAVGTMEIHEIEYTPKSKGKVGER